jgi:hypothetical protein
MNSIEEIFKNSLKDIEAPYDPEAWEAMSKRLDQNLPVKNLKTSFKWAWVASSILIVGVAAFFALQKNEASTNIAKKLNEGENPIANENNVESKNATVKQIAATSNIESISSSKDIALNNNEGTDKEMLNGIPPKKAENIYIPNPADFGTSDSEIILPKFSDKYCENEIIEIKNTNDKTINLISSNGFNKAISEKNIANLELKTGEYFFSFIKNGKIQKEFAFTVIPKPKVDFYANDETLYENGLPINQLKPTYPMNEYIWLNNKEEIIARGEEPQVHLFTKGSHDITLKVKDLNGCTNQITKSIRCEVNYNLLAMSGFNPESASIKNRTFIPYALLERNIPFEMEIIDPKSGQVIFATRNTDEPWDGINRISNQMIPEGATYIWKVKIFKQEIGESKNVYQGSITRM